MTCRKQALRRLLVATCTAVLALVPVITSPPQPAQAADPLPRLGLRAAASEVTVSRYGSEIYGDLGLYLVAGDEPFEIRVHRPDYGMPLHAEITGSTPGVIPPALVPTFAGLKRFAMTTYVDSEGTVVARKSSDLCPNNYDPVRMRADAPSRSRYPQECSGNPYSLGAVWGIERGYGISLPTAFSTKLKRGKTYTARTRITKAYRDLLGLTAEQATATVTVRVEDAQFVSKPRLRQQTAQPEPEALQGREIAPTGPLPDLRSLPAWDIRVSKGRYLQFSATVWNAGPGQLRVEGFRSDTNRDLMDAYQYFTDNGGNQVGYAPVGGMEWDARRGHRHWHFIDFATYRLLTYDKRLVVRSQKEAFCLVNTDMVDYTVPGANWRPDQTGLDSACGDRDSLGVREALEAGSGDTYVQWLPGQSFDLRGVPNGRYLIEVRANPEGVLHEVSTADNASYRQVIISGRSGHRKATIAPIGIINERHWFDDEEF